MFFLIFLLGLVPLFVAAQSNVTCLGYTDGTNFTTPNGFIYTVHCNLDQTVVDVGGNSNIFTYQECTQYCDELPACVAVVINATAPGSGCHLKGSTDPNPDTAYDSAVQVYTPPLSCQNVTNGSIVTYGDVQYQVFCQYDINELDNGYNGNINSFSDCADYCNPRPNNLAFVVSSAFSGGTGCSCKSNITSTGSSNQYDALFAVGTISSTATSTTTSLTIASTSIPTSVPIITSLSSDVVTLSSVLSTQVVSTSIPLPTSTAIPSSIDSSVSPTSVTSPSQMSTETATMAPSSAALSTDASSAPSSTSLLPPASSASEFSSSQSFASASSAASALSSSVPSTATTTAAASNTPSIALRVDVPALGSQFYVASDGRLTNNPSLAVALSIINGSLYASVSSGLRARQATSNQYSTNSGVIHQLFAPITPVGDITTSFSISSSQGLVWSNALFATDPTDFCIVDLHLYALFQPSPGFCQYAATVSAVPIAAISSSASASATSAMSASSASAVSASSASVATPSPITVDNYYNNTTYNSVVYNVNINVNIPAGYNYMSADPGSFYAQLCPTCPIVQVLSGNLTYATVPCAFCAPVVMQLSSASGSPVNNQACSNYTYGSSSCLSCQASSPAANLTVLSLACSTCASSMTAVVVPSSAASSVQSLASASGAAAAVSAASQAMAGVAITQTAPAAASSVINVACSNCPAGSVAVTLPVTTATAGTGSTGAFKGDASSVILHRALLFVAAAAFLL